MDLRRSARSLHAGCVVMLLVALAVVVPGASPVAAATYDTVDGLFSATGPVGNGGTKSLTVVGRGGVPATGVGAVALNITITNPTTPSFLTVWPAGATKPTASNLNFVAGQTIPNMVVVPVGTNGQVSIYNHAGAVDVIVDVLGWFPEGGSFNGLNPARLMDTRPDGTTVDGAFLAGGRLGAATATSVTVVGRGGVPATGVGAVALNITITNPTTPSFLTVWPAGATKPTASNLNFVAGQTIPNMVVVPVGTNGQVSIYNHAGAVDVIVDVLGWFPEGGSFNGLNPARLMDTRPDGTTVDGAFLAGGRLGAATATSVTVVGRGGVPATGVGAVALNITITNPTTPSFLTVWPAGATKPTASNLNFVAGQTIPNMVVVPVGTNGQVSIYNHAGAVDVIVDVLGWFPEGGSFNGLNPARLMDTRVPDPLPAAAAGAKRQRLVAYPVMHETAGIDRIAVWVCDIPPTSTLSIYTLDPGTDDTSLVIDPNHVAAEAQRIVGTYYRNISGGRYVPVFVGMGHIQLGDREFAADCVDKAQALTPAGFTNVLATDTFVYAGGQASPGYLWADSNEILRRPPSVTRRYMWVGGGAFVEPRPDYWVLAHELGHSIHWPHSYYGPDSEYDNPTDLMSNPPVDRACDEPGPAGTGIPCEPTSTMAFNRFADGWIDEGQVLVHDGGTSTVALFGTGGPGVQMLAAPDAQDSHVMLTLEARQNVGYDGDLPFGGIVASIVDQRSNECVDGRVFRACISIERRQAPAVGAPNTYDMLLQAGSTTSIYGVTVTVVGQEGDGYRVQVSGTFVAPPQLPRAVDPFA